ncbi:hypothetical protein [Leptospira santarosai]|uniref:hypothetical protein n=1 Tax=Leptospira santarosai TaxID=28183 RepID=UPI003D15F38E
MTLRSVLRPRIILIYESLSTDRVWKLSETLSTDRVWKLSETLSTDRVSGSGFDSERKLQLF